MNFCSLVMLTALDFIQVFLVRIRSFVVQSPPPPKKNNNKETSIPETQNPNKKLKSHSLNGYKYLTMKHCSNM